MSRRRIRSDLESEDEIEEQSVSTAKRTRIDPEIGSSQSNGSDPMQVVDENKPLVFGEDGFVEGSIVKITLTNFVTYDYCEIFPGPQMNMIVGPNGTGKSTIVCAIALGLGGSPNLLGRAKNIAEFVKTGEDEATITIELKKVNVRNIVIQRSFKKSNNATTWRLNGKSCTQKDVMTIINGFNIQVDNLCQFLPQDRVAEFAELSPAQLLERTQTAAGKTDLHAMQKQLMEWRDIQKALMRSNHSDVEHLKTLNQRNADVERDVLRMQAKQKIEDDIKLLKAQIPLVKYSESKAELNRLAELYNVEKEKVRKAKAEVAPIRDELRLCESENNESKKKKAEQERKYQQSLALAKDISKKIEEQRSEMNISKKEIDSIKRKIPEREKQIKYAENRITATEEELKEPPSNDTSELEAAIAEVNKETSELHAQVTDIDLQVREENKKKGELVTSLSIKDRELKELRNVMNVRLNKLNREYPDTVKAYRWLKENKNTFSGRVYEPVLYHLNLKDSKYADLVENALGGARSSHFRTFICEKKEDYHKFTAYATDEMKWKVSISWPGELPDSLRKTPCSTEDLRTKFGMDYFVSDLLEGPEFILRALCLEANINRLPVAIKSSKERQLVESGLFKKFGIGSTFYNVKSSAYGKQSKQTITTAVRKAMYLGNSVDSEAISNLQQQIRHIQASLQEADNIIKEFGTKHDQIKRLIDEKKHAKEDLQAQKRDIQLKAQRYKTKLHNLERMKKELEELRKKPELDKEKITELEVSMRHFAEKEDELFEKYGRALEKCVDLYEKRNLSILGYVHTEARYIAVTHYARQHTSGLEAAEAGMVSAKREHAIAERATKRYMEDCSRAGHDLPEHLDARYKEIVSRWKQEGLNTTLDQLEETIAEEEGRAEAIRFANPDAMRDYAGRKAEIENLESKIEQNRSKLDKLEQKITTLRDKWAPLIRKLVSDINEKFSAAFQRIHCVGEVAVDESEDFDKWGINIYVKFRDNEKLQLLTGQRQSGGERSVTTILFLMSLQDLAKSPFRVVDEINQGMDPRNERMIHEQIVQGASRPGTSQYFLITPKLLPDLYYNERMRVLCIYNSEWLPIKIKPLADYLEHAKRTGAA